MSFPVILSAIVSFSSRLLAGKSFYKQKIDGMVLHLVQQEHVYILMENTQEMSGKEKQRISHQELLIRVQACKRQKPNSVKEQTSLTFYRWKD